MEETTRRLIIALTTVCAFGLSGAVAMATDTGPTIAAPVNPIVGWWPTRPLCVRDATTGRVLCYQDL